MCDMNPTRYIDNPATKDKEDSFQDWYSKEDIPCKYYWILAQVFRFLSEKRNNINYLMSMIDRMKS